MGRIMANENLGTELLQPLCVGAGLGIGALDHIANPKHDLGNAAHANAPNANEVHGSEVEGYGTSVHALWVADLPQRSKWGMRLIFALKSPPSVRPDQQGARHRQG